MKKLKRTSSTGICKNGSKPLSQNKNTSAKNIKNRPKKLFKEAVEKENILIQEPDSKYAKFKMNNNLKKKVSQKKNKRSKSLLYDRKIMPKIDTTNNSSRLIQQLQYFRSQDSKTPIHARVNVASVREIPPNPDIQSFVDYSPLLVKNKNYSLSQPKQILIEDASIQCQRFELQEDSREIKERQQNAAEKQSLKSKIAELQTKMNQMLQQSNLREIKMKSSYQQQAHDLNSSIIALKEQNISLLKQKNQLKKTIDEQSSQIHMHKEKQSKLQDRLKDEQRIKQKLIKDNEQSKKQIQFYRQELTCFEESLCELKKMKKVYEKRLDQLQSQKVRIKSQACQLLNMVQRCKQQQQSSDE